MIHVVFICKKDNPAVDTVIEFYKANQENAQAAIIHYHDYDKTFPESSDAKDCSWQPMTDLCSTNVNEWETNLKQAAESVHRLVDALPAAGCLLDVFMCLQDDRTNSDYVLLLGALRRLKDWHNARFTILDPDASPHSEFLQRFLAAEVSLGAIGCTSPEAVGYTALDKGLLWRGKVCVSDKIENKGFTVPGLSLYRASSDTPDLMFPSQEPAQCMDRAHLGRTFEILDEVLLMSVPSFYRTPHTYKLCLYQKPAVAQVLMNYIQESDTKGLLARLAVYSGTHIASCAEVGLSTEAWKENIMADIVYAQEPEEEFQDGYEFLYFLLVAPDNRTSPENFVATACLLRHPYHLSGHLVTSIFHQCLVPVKGNEVVGEKGDNCCDHDNLDLSCLPSLNAEMVEHIERDVLQLQRVKLQSWKDERQANNQSTEMATNELTAILANVRTQYLEQLRARLPTSTLMSSTEKVLNLQKEVYEASENSYEWPERLVQQYMESQRRCLSRLPSSESMALSSPLQHNEAGVSTVDIDSLLRCFHPDGSASLERMSPVRRRRASRGHSKVSEPPAGDRPSTTWPECRDLNTHDIYYNLDKKAEKINTHLNRFQEKYVKDETLSSCQSHIVLFPKSSKTVSKDSKESALRRSPRKQKPEGRDLSVDPPRRLSMDQSVENLKGPTHATLRDKENKRRYSTPVAMPVPGKQAKHSRTDSSRRQSVASSVLPRQVEKLRRESDADTSLSGVKGTESRSQRHKRRLQEIVDRVLADHGVTPGDLIFTSCSTRLYKVTKLFVMDLPNSRNLKDEMKKIAEGQVEQVIALDRQRQGAKADRCSRRR
ncbi:mdm2-binding protein-like isoform X2 [Dreissena polymorpha]|uniref:mdm2-binding protein-like isoform X2 n=1 Tax=Dreissena polymorpha TaxID=45954 RepID=UPI002264B723|nr:mdm2-binding protein-like isoform X2 [Dreissena polymorpha]